MQLTPRIVVTTEKLAVTNLSVFKALQAFYITRSLFTVKFQILGDATIKIMGFWYVISSVLL
jgi:hypothetical protein